MGDTRLRDRRRLAGPVLAVVLGAGLLPTATVPSTLAATPSNDDPADAITIAGSAGAISGSTAEATSDACQLLAYPPNQFPHRSVWFEWTAPYTGWLHLRTDGSAFEVQMSLQEVYGPCPVAGASLGPSRTAVRQGVTYWLGVGSNNPAVGGAFVVSWYLRRPPPPPNDDFVRALEIFGRYGATQGENANASKEAGEPAHAGEPGGRSLWFAGGHRPAGELRSTPTVARSRPIRSSRSTRVRRSAPSRRSRATPTPAGTIGRHD